MFNWLYKFFKKPKTHKIECVWCKYEKTEEEIQYILDDNKCICVECFPEWADHEIAELDWKLKKVKTLTQQAQEELDNPEVCNKKLNEILEI